MRAIILALERIDYKGLLTAPHVLIAGTTGSGKSVLLRGLIDERLRHIGNSQLILIDTKRVELAQFARLRCVSRYANTAEKAAAALADAVKYMRGIYRDMERRGAVLSPFAPVYIIIDELADLMVSEEVKAIRRDLQTLLQLGRAARVHVIAATQAPNRRTIPAEIVLNFTHRVALRCLSPIESRQIIGTAGAETLPKYGRALMLTPDGCEPVAIPYTSPEDVAELVNRLPRRLFRLRR